MPTPTRTDIPTRPALQWPVGVRLRFRAGAALSARHRGLRGTPAIVLSELQLIGPSADDPSYSWRQEVLAFSNCRVGWARPDQLELPDDDEAM